MEIKIIGTPKEIADFVQGLQSRSIMLNSVLNVDGKEIVSHLPKPALRTYTEPQTKSKEEK